MTSVRSKSLWYLATIVALAFAVRQPVAGQRAGTLPASLTDRDFWALTERISEPDGVFRSISGSTDNLLSNEPNVSVVAAALATRVKPSGVYLGVGPEQNFSYIAATHPRMAFIADIRRGNLHLHLMYKALFEMSANRADFAGRLFSRKRPAGLALGSSASDLMQAYLTATPVDDATFTANVKALDDHLTKTRSLPLGAEDLAGIEYVYRSFYKFGPGIFYTASINGRPGSAITYAALMSATDGTSSGRIRTYLASEESFTLVKTLEQNNLIVPIVGDFAGPKALRAVGAFLKEHGALVSAFYVSNVEEYLQRNGVWPKFCANVASMPLDPTSVFIRPSVARSANALGEIVSETKSCGENPR
jgi:hypothetical protein